MKPKEFKISAILIVLLILTVKPNFSQVLISNSEGNPDNSAMLEIKSSDKGLLIPRVTTEKRNMITPVAGLLVFDSDIGSFFLYGKTAGGGSAWIDLSSNAGIWTRTDNDVYLSNTAYNIGIGTTTPNKKLVIKASSDTDTLMEIQDKNGNPIMIVTPVLTKFNFLKSAKASGISGGFAVGRYATAKDGKALTDTALFLVTPDSTRVYTSGVTGISGGFAVGRYATAKGKQYISKSFFTDYDSTRVYTDGSGVPGKKGISGGFAVGRYATAKGTQTYNFFTDVDSTRVFTGGIGTKGVSGGFAVGRYATAKGVRNFNFITNYDSTIVNVNDSTAGFNVINVGGGTEQRIMRMTTDNYFLGHETGDKIVPAGSLGKYNSFIGYRAGKNTVSGRKNIAIGYYSGYDNDADFNVFIGNQSGKVNKGDYNIFVGHNTGINNSTGNSNIFIGYNAGQANLGGYTNIAIGYGSAYSNISGFDNTFLGNFSGYSNQTGSSNLFVGKESGYYQSSGANNVMLGNSSGYWNMAGDGNVFIGYKAGFYEFGSGKLYIENSDSTAPLIFGDFDLNYVTINDVLKLTPRNQAPDTPAEGMMYYDAGTKKLMVWDGESWQACW